MAACRGLPIRRPTNRLLPVTFAKTPPNLLEALLHSFGRLGRVGHNRPYRTERNLRSKTVIRGISPFPSLFLSFEVLSHSSRCQAVPLRQAFSRPTDRAEDPPQRLRPSNRRRPEASACWIWPRTALTVLQPFVAGFLPSDFRGEGCPTCPDARAFFN